MAGADDLRAVLEAYRQVTDAGWPTLHPGMAERSKRWATASEAELRSELDGYVREASSAGSPIRVFWKTGPEFTYGGANELFARDAGLKGPNELVGLNDFDKRLPWKPQAAKYRSDDEGVVSKGTVFSAIERQTSASGQVSWLRVGKAPIRLANGKPNGVLGMYEVLDAAQGPRLYGEWIRSQSKAAKM